MMNIFMYANWAFILCLLNKVSVEIFCPSFNQRLVVFLLNFFEGSSTLNRNLLPDMWFANIFPSGL